jgi:transcriptional regulator with XRE-family HTH domain
VGFPDQLAELRRARGLTQAALAERIGVQANQVSRYESGRSEPTLGVLRQLAIALSVSCDTLVFGGEDRLSSDQALQLAFEATLLLDSDEQTAVRMLLEGFLATHQDRRGGEGPRARRRTAT